MVFESPFYTIKFLVTNKRHQLFSIESHYKYTVYFYYIKKLFFIVFILWGGFGGYYN